MRLIVTNDAGVEAARLAYRSTSEVTEIEADKVAALVVKHRETDPWFQKNLEESIARALEPLCKTADKRVLLVFVNDEVTLRTLDERRMREAGWVRAR